MAKYRVKIKGKPLEVEAPDDASDEQIAEAVSAKHGDQVFGDRMIKQDLDEQKRVYKEQATTYQAYGRQEAILQDIETKKKEKGVTDLEGRIRSIRAQESDLSKQMEAARQDPDQAKARAAWSKAAEASNPLFNKRQKLFGEMRKLDPKRADELFDELYVDR